MLHAGKKTVCGLLSAVLIFVLSACGERVEFAEKKIPVDEQEIQLVLQADELALLDQLPQLQRADLSGSTCYREILQWSQEHPHVEVIYTVAFPDGSVVDNHCETLDLSGLSGEDADKAAELMQWLPQLKSLVLQPGSFTPQQVNTLYTAVPGLETSYSFALADMQVDYFAQSLDLSTLHSGQVEEALALLPQLPHLKQVALGNDAAGLLSWEDIYALTQACPEVDFSFSFSVYGKPFTLLDKEMDFNHIPLTDSGAQALQAARCMKNLEYLDMDFCGVDNEAMAYIRDSLPGVKVVWRIWFGAAYSVRTDVEKILASKPSVGGLLGDKDVQVLKYCTDVKYIDLGHNEFITDISFLGYMPKLEVAVLAMNRITDISPLANCPELEYLEIQTNDELGDLSPLANCPKLAHLNVAHCRNVADITPLFGLTKLERFWLGSGNKVPQEQVEEFKKLMPDCTVDTNVFADPTLGGWRIIDINFDSGIETCATRYELLREQFGYRENDYSFYWKDPKYNAQ